MEQADVPYGVSMQADVPATLPLRGLISTNRER